MTISIAPGFSYKQHILLQIKIIKEKLEKCIRKNWISAVNRLGFGRTPFKEALYRPRTGFENLEKKLVT